MLKLPMHRLQLQAKLLQAANGDAIGMRAQGLGRQHLRQIGVRLLDESATHRRLARGHFIARTFSAAVRAAATRESRRDDAAPRDTGVSAARYSRAACLRISTSPAGLRLRLDREGG